METIPRGRCQPKKFDRWERTRLWWSTRGSHWRAQTSKENTKIDIFERAIFIERNFWTNLEGTTGSGWYYNARGEFARVFDRLVEGYSKYLLGLGLVGGGEDDHDVKVVRGHGDLWPVVGVLTLNFFEWVPDWGIDWSQRSNWHCPVGEVFKVGEDDVILRNAKTVEVQKCRWWRSPGYLKSGSKWKVSAFSKSE